MSKLLLNPARTFRWRESTRAPVGQPGAWSPLDHVAAGDYVADERAYRKRRCLLALPPRDQARQHSAEPHQLTVSRKWLTVAIPFAQLRNFHAGFASRNLAVPPACQFLSINSRHGEIFDEFPAYPPTVTSLHLSTFVDPRAMRPIMQFPPTLRDLTLAYPIKEDMPELGIVFDHLPRLLSRLKITFKPPYNDVDVDDHPHGDKCLNALTRALKRLRQLQVFFHDLVHVDGLSAILDALATREHPADGPFQPLQSLTLGLLVLDPIDEAALARAHPRARFHVRDLTIFIWEWEDPHPDLDACTILASIPAPKRARFT
ncbi:hypothetical protein GGF32_000109 [Allomyces javanicus]|nr:hypothetical protein GGF32_000109 [Allomyces javanicus]